MDVDKRPNITNDRDIASTNKHPSSFIEWAQTFTRKILTSIIIDLAISRHIEDSLHPV